MQVSDNKDPGQVALWRQVSEDRFCDDNGPKAQVTGSQTPSILERGERDARQLREVAGSWRARLRCNRRFTVLPLRSQVLK